MERTSPALAIDNKSGVEEQILRFDRADIGAVRFCIPFLRFRFSGQTAVVDFEVRRCEQD